MPDLLVIGGTGFLGRRLVALAAGPVEATYHRTSPSDDRPLWHECSLTDGGASAAALIERRRPTAVINAAYVSGGPELEAVTAAAPGRMAEAARAVGARFVHLSTDVVFDGRTERAYRESDPPSPVHGYGRAKAASEDGVAAADPGAVVVRTSLLWGDRDDPGPQVRMAAEPEMIFFDDEYRNPLHVSALATACLELARRDDVSGVLHVAGADTVSRLEFARRVSPLVDIDPSTVRGAPTPPGSSRPRNCPLDTSRARALIETRLPGIREVTA